MLNKRLIVTTALLVAVSVPSIAFCATPSKPTTKKTPTVTKSATTKPVAKPVKPTEAKKTVKPTEVKKLTTPADNQATQGINTSMDISKIGVRVLVNNFKECFDFYTQKLGFEVFWGNENGPFAAFKAAGSDEPCFSMFLAKNMQTYEGYTPLTGTGRTDQAVYVIPSNNVDEAYKALKAKGVEFIGEPRTIKDWYMRCVYFRDPDGNLFEICQDNVE